MLLTQAIHTLDLMISLAGLPVEVAGYAVTSPVHSMETEDLAMAAIKFANGGIGAISATTCGLSRAYPTRWISSAPRAWPGSKARI